MALVLAGIRIASVAAEGVDWREEWQKAGNCANLACCAREIGLCNIVLLHHTYLDRGLVRTHLAERQHIEGVVIGVYY